MGPTVDSISPAYDVVEFSSFGADIDLTTAASSWCKRPARAITIVTAGAGGLVIQVVNPDAVTNRTLSALTSGERLEPIQVRKIIASGTTVSKIRVYW